MTRDLCALILIGLLFAVSSSGQNGIENRKSLDSDSPAPFRIEQGKSFSAFGSDPGRRRPEPPMRRTQVTNDLDEALRIVLSNHSSGARLNPETLTSEAISSMLKTLDPHSNYFPRPEFQELLSEHNSEYSGTGSSIIGYRLSDQLDSYVVATVPGSPAAKADLKYGDRIVSVNGSPVSGLPPETVKEMVRGNAGTFAELVVEKTSTGKFERIKLLRERIHTPSVRNAFIVEDGIAYVDMSAGFQYSTSGELDLALEHLKPASIRGLILDLRGNGGGLVEQAVKVAERFLPAGSLILSQRGRYHDDVRIWRSNNPKPDVVPLVILIDESTASAAEVVAGAMQDNDRAILVGSKTFGKGLVQSVLPLPHGAGLTLTAARYYTPSGRSIQRDYAGTGLYDYFNHRTQNAGIDRSIFAAKTVTERIVYGGDGITPDEIVDNEKSHRTQGQLAAASFFFVRRALSTGSGFNAFGDKSDLGLLSAFTSFLKDHEEWSNLATSVNKRPQQVVGLIRYQLTLAASGIDEAEKTKLANDPLVTRARNTLPKAAALYVAAQQNSTRESRKKAR